MPALAEPAHSRPAVWSHLGRVGPADGARENTVAAFEAASAAGVDGIELDVWRTLDGAWVVHHDRYRASGPLDRLRRAEVPELLPDLAADLVSLGREGSGGNFVLSSFSAVAARAALLSSPDLRAGLLVEGTTASRVTPAGPSYWSVHVWHGSLSEEDVARFYAMVATHDQQKPSAVLLDLGGVFLDWDPRYLYRQLFGDDVAGMEYFLTNVCPPAWHVEQDRGQSISEACAERRSKFPEYAEMIDAWGDRAEEMIRGVIPGTVDVFVELKATGVPCYALSNMERENWERRVEIYDFLGWFDGHFISGLEGVIKPDSEYFMRALERFELQPEEVLFVDDREDNVAAALALGMPAVVFTSPEALRDELVARGLLRPQVAPA